MPELKESLLSQIAVAGVIFLKKVFWHTFLEFYLFNSANSFAFALYCLNCIGLTLTISWVWIIYYGQGQQWNMSNSIAGNSQ
ncbi:hypothetical protein [uncultured Bacteroides sp.]|uniref:hypothetical protein n=1 Tax=uncultured Bacteroides sp. TaxID=162156 RepID=UPI00262106EF|nr:hypothetical protein [uncultured Bacteroides sp.]